MVERIGRRRKPSAPRLVDRQVSGETSKVLTIKYGLSDHRELVMNPGNNWKEFTAPVVNVKFADGPRKQGS